ncbi:sulfotransferase [Methylocystis sp. MJC1]|uniref:tetratricopeptide repeat-containing sulfotransferase family protein n=1 Tax=Methylocystis sp. MJC1 TaxID=2654282 RepID=UPI0013EE3C6E|nr:sulfotransferase [Methylocystis sp. MJC1]KAF2990113.1 hypothetical protein MJC1_02773 [Methylocystis sp. MJC1]MBU6527631.1 sulfotransferase [Methylocystis sp. MJC1]UZX10572.1 sulfotransferase [Methylocystis sp. MJC1]
MKITLSKTVAAAMAAFANGDVASTEQLCKAELDRNPKSGRAWALLAETAWLRNRPDAARICADRAATHSPDDALCQITRAKIMHLRGEAAEALNAAQSAAPLATSPVAQDSLAAVFGLLGRHAQALELSRCAVAARPDEAQFLFNLAATERMLGALDAAEAHCDAAIARRPNFALAYYLRSDLRCQTTTRNHIEEIRDRLRQGVTNALDEATLRYALAKEFEDLQEDARAFAEVAAAARLWRDNMRYDAKAELTFVYRLIETQNTTRLASLPKSRLDASPIFVCGLPRSGTTLAERILASHSAIESIGETNYFAVESTRAARGSRADFGALGAAYLAAIESVCAPTKNRILDKTLENYLYCGLIHAALPRAKIILIERDPMDMAWSLYKAHFNGKFLFSYDLQELADYCVAYRRLAEHWRKTLPSACVLTVRYEDIVADIATQSRRMIEFLGLPWEDGVLRFHESRAPSATASAVQIRRPLYDTSVGKWRRHAQALEPFRDRLKQLAPDLVTDMTSV